MRIKIKLIGLLMLFVSSIQAQSIELLTDLSPGGQSGDFLSPIRFGDQIIYGNIGPSDVFELWVSDGSAAGTDLVFEDSNDQIDICGIEPYFRVGELLFFCGSVSSTEMLIYNISSGEVETILPVGYSYFRPNNFVSFNDKVVFTAESDVHGREYYITDGTAEGTSLLKDIAIGVASGLPTDLPYPTYFEFEDKLVFQADEGIYGVELWITDGTTAGTHLLKDLDNSPDNSRKGFLGWGLENHFFFGAENGNFDIELWLSDGTTEGTQVLKDVLGMDELTNLRMLAVLNNKFLFVATTAGSQILWETDGSPSGTNIIYDLGPGVYDVGFLAAREDYLVFSIDDYISNEQHIWRTDGTAQGTFNMVSAEWNPFMRGFFPFCDLGEKVILGRVDFFDEYLWVTDGTVAGTEVIAEVSTSTLMGGFYLEETEVEKGIIGGKLYFRGFTESNGHELWQTDGSISGTFMLEDFVTGVEGLMPSGIISLDDQVLFFGSNPEFGREPHRLVVKTTSTAQSQKNDRSLLLYPNPTSGQFKIEWPNNSESFKGEILDIEGRMLWSDSSISSGQYLSVNLQAGVYILRLSNETTQLSKKLLIE